MNETVDVEEAILLKNNCEDEINAQSVNFKLLIFKTTVYKSSDIMLLVSKSNCFSSKKLLLLNNIKYYFI